MLSWLTHRRRAVLAAAALLAALLVPGLLRLETDNSPEVFFVRGSEAVERYREFRREFGGDVVVRLVASGEALWTRGGLDWLRRLEEETAALPGIESVSGLYRHWRSAWPASAADVETFRRRARSNRLDRALGWIDAEGATVTATAVLAETSPEEVRRLLGRLRQILATAPPGVDAELAGGPLLNAALDDSSREIGRRYFPLLVVLSLAVLTLVVRSLTGLFIPLAFVGFCELLALAPMGYAGSELNLVLAVLPPLVFVIALATALHVLLRFRDLRSARPRDDPAAVCEATYREKGWPILWTGLTTLIAFASLAVSPVGPVRSLGLWAALALGLMTLAAFTLYPALLSLPVTAARGQRRFELGAHRLGGRWGRWAYRHRRGVVLAAAAAALLAVAGWPRIRIESNALRYLAADHPVRMRFEALEEKGIGLAAVEIVVTPAGGGASPFADPAAIDRLAAVGDRLEREALVHGVLSAGAVLRDAAERVPRLPVVDPATHRVLVFQRLEADPEGRRILARLLSSDRRRARVSALVATVGLDQLEPLLARFEGAALAVFPGAAVEITGEYPLLLEAQRYLLSTLAASLGLTLVAVAAVLRLLLPGTRLALLALLPNLWPVVGVFGAMGWLGVPLDIATVMVASIALGLAVDDTLHTLGHFRRLAPRHGAREAVRRTLQITAPAYLLTGVVLTAGFGVCALSDFAPIARFGALSATAIMLAVLGDLFLLPAILGLTPRRTLARWAPARGKGFRPDL